MEGKNLTLTITNKNWKNWVVFILTILPIPDEKKIEILEEIGEEEEWEN